MLAGTDLAHRDALHFLGTVAEQCTRLRVDVHQRTGVPVVDEDRVLGGLEDRLVARLGNSPRFLRALALDLGGGAGGEDLQHRLDQAAVAQGVLGHDGDEAQRRVGRVGQRIGGIALDAQPHEGVVVPVDLLHAFWDVSELLSHHRAAHGSWQPVLHDRFEAAVGIDRQRADPVILRRDAARDEGALHAQCGGEVARQFLEQRVALCGGYGQGGAAQRRFGAFAPGDVRGDAADGIGIAGTVEQRKLDREVGARLPIDDQRLLDLLRRTQLEHAAVVRAQLRRDLRREQIDVVCAVQLLLRAVEHFAEAAVDEQVLAVRVFDEHHCRGVLEHLTQALLAVAQRLLRFAQPGDVANARDDARRAIELYGLELHDCLERRAVGGEQLRQHALRQVGERGARGLVHGCHRIDAADLCGGEKVCRAAGRYRGPRAAEQRRRRLVACLEIQVGIENEDSLGRRGHQVLVFRVVSAELAHGGKGSIG